MKGRVIVICEAELEIEFAGETPSGSRPGGVLLNVAAELARRGHGVSVVSETGRDRAGDIIIDYLAKAGADTRSVDRTTDWSTPVELKFDDGSVIRYENYGTSSGLDVVWPDIERDDTVVFGGYQSLSAHARERLWQLVSHVAERGIRLVYYPGRLATREPRITRVMPRVFENLEVADVVITTPDSNRHIFGNGDGPTVYRNHVKFYCDKMVDIDMTAGVTTWYGNDEKTADTGADEVKAIADVVESLG